MRLRLSLILVMLSSPAFSDDCRVDLFKSFLSRKSEYFNDYRFSRFMSREDFEAASKASGGDVNIFGYGSGGYDYESYREKSTSSSESESLFNTTNQFENVLWTGLDQSGAKAYSDCLIANNYGLFLVPELATEKQVALRLVYKPTKGGDEPVDIEWKISGKIPPNLETSVRPHRDVLFYVDRPEKGEEIIIAARVEDALATPVFISYLPPPLERIEDPDFQQINVELGGSYFYDVGDFRISELSYSNVTGNHDISTFSMKVDRLSTPDQGDRANGTFDNSKPWEQQVRCNNYGDQSFEFAFHGFNDGASNLYFRVLNRHCN